MDPLIARIKERVADPLRAIDAATWVEPMPTIAPPATPADADAAEALLGFPLPPLVRALYTEIGNGGWGPGYGLLRLLDGDSGDRMDDEDSLVSWARWHRRYSPHRPGEPGWPEGVVPLVEWGCHYTSCVDCLDPACPVYFYDNDVVASRGGISPPDYLYPQAGSLAGWLSAWLDGADLWAAGPKAKRQAEPAAAADAAPRAGPRC